MKLHARSTGIPDNGNVHKMFFADRVIATASDDFPEEAACVEVPVPFSRRHLDVCHGDGIILLDESLSHHDLPQNVLDAPYRILNPQGLRLEPSTE